MWRIPLGLAIRQNKKTTTEAANRKPKQAWKMGAGNLIR